MIRRSLLLASAIVLAALNVSSIAAQTAPEPIRYTLRFPASQTHYAEALSYFGLRFRPVDARNARPYLGVVTRTDNGRLLISQVRRGTPAHEAGLNVDDEILVIDDVRVRVDGLDTQLDIYKPGDADPGRPWRLEVAPDASGEQNNA